MKKSPVRFPLHIRVARYVKRNKMEILAASAFLLLLVAHDLVEYLANLMGV